MNLIILISKKSPEAQPIIFITPDTMSGDDLDDEYPSIAETHHVVTVYGDQPTVVTDYRAIIEMVKDGAS